MQSEFNHIDDFFRKKEEEASADNSMQDQHWQQMKGLLVNPAPPLGKIRTLNPKMLWQILIGVSFVSVIGLLVWRNSESKQNDILIDSPIQFQQPTVKTNKAVPS